MKMGAPIYHVYNKIQAIGRVSRLQNDYNIEQVCVWDRMSERVCILWVLIRSIKFSSSHLTNLRAKKRAPVLRALTDDAQIMLTGPVDE